VLLRGGGQPKVQGRARSCSIARANAARHASHIPWETACWPPRSRTRPHQAHTRDGAEGAKLPGCTARTIRTGRADGSFGEPIVTEVLRNGEFTSLPYQGNPQSSGQAHRHRVPRPGGGSRSVRAFGEHTGRTFHLRSDGRLNRGRHSTRGIGGDLRTIAVACTKDRERHTIAKTLMGCAARLSPPFHRVVT
jgi:hypothetical protein